MEQGRRGGRRLKWGGAGGAGRHKGSQASLRNERVAPCDLGSRAKGIGPGAAPGEPEAGGNAPIVLGESRGWSRLEKAPASVHCQLYKAQRPATGAARPFLQKSKRVQLMAGPLLAGRSWVRERGRELSWGSRSRSLPPPPILQFSLECRADSPDASEKSV